MKIMRDMKGQLFNSRAVPFLKVGLRRDEGHSTLHPGGKTHVGPISKIHFETIPCFTQQKERERVPEIIWVLEGNLEVLACCVD